MGFNNQDTSHLYLDRPIRTLGQDRLNRDSFVQSLAGRLVRNGKSTGLVLGLNGSWGSGKTSILNLLQNELELKSAYNQPLVVRFEPWLISNRDDLISNFFATLTDSLREKLGYYDVYNSGQDQQYDKAIRVISSYGESLSPLFNALVPTSGVGIKALGKYLKSEDDKRSNVHFKRALVRKHLNKFQFPIVVMIDELDRIEDSEIRTMAQLLRSIGDFENVSYIVAFDEGRVLQSLGNGSDAGSMEHGRSYLEKIIQISVQLPILDSQQISDLLRAELKELYESFDIHLNGAQQNNLRFILNTVTPHPISTSRDIRKVMADYAGRILEFLGIVDPVELLAFIILAHKDPRSTSRITNFAGVAAYRLGFPDASQLASYKAFGTQAGGGRPSLIREGAEEWAKRLINKLWPDHPEHTPRLQDIRSDLVAVRPALNALLRHDARSERPDRNQRHRIARHLNAGNFEIIRRLGKIRDQIRVGCQTDEFAQVFDDLGLRRFLSYTALRGSEILAERRSASTDPENLLRLGSMLNRLVTRRDHDSDDFAGTLSRILERKQIEVPAAILAQTNILRHCSNKIFGLFPCPLPDKTANNLRKLAVQEAIRSPEHCNSPVIVALWAPSVGDEKYSFGDFNDWIVEKCSDERFLADLLKFVFHSPYETRTIRSSQNKLQMPMLTMAPTTVEKLVSVISNHQGFSSRFDKTEEFNNLLSFQKGW